MVELKSISKPRAKIESAEFEKSPTKLLKGNFGSDSEASISSNILLVKGKGAPIIPQTYPRNMGLKSVIESIIGTDDRTRILDTIATPWRMICGLRIESPFGTFIGTGWFAGPKTLITAGHCVYDIQQMGGWANTISVSPGRNGDNFPFETIKSERFSTLDLWKKSRDPDFDIGAIHLDRPLGNETGWFSVGSLPPRELENFMVNISGYPADRGRGREQWFHKNRILRVTPRRIFYDVDSFGGQSGSPVWIYESNSSEPIVVGIHAYGIGGTPSDWGITANSAPRIIPEVIEQIEAWVKSDNDNLIDETLDPCQRESTRIAELEWLVEELKMRLKTVEGAQLED